MQSPVIKGGFQFVSELPSPDNILGERMYVDSDRLRQTVAYINNHQVLSLVFTPAKYKLDNLDFLRELPGVQGLYIQKSFADLSPLYAQKGLRVLRLQEPIGDLPALKHLELRKTGDIRSIAFLETLPALEWVTLGLKVVDGDMSFLKRVRKVGFIGHPHYTHKMKDFQIEMP
jgi:hypothetical protein